MYALYKASVATLAPIWGNYSERPFYSDADWRGDGATIVTDDRVDRSVIWRASDGAAVGQSPTHDDRVYSVRFAPDGSRMAESDRDGYLRQLSGNGASIECSTLVWAHSDGRRDSGLDWAPDSSRVAVSAKDDSVHIYNARQCANPTVLLPIYRDDNSEILSLDWSPDGRLIAGAGAYVHIWDVQSGAVLATLQTSVSDDNARTVCWSPSGNMLAVADGSSIKVYMPFDYSPPEVRISAPDDGTITAQSFVTVTGEIVDDLFVSGATLAINEGLADALELGAGGTFERRVDLNLGENTIKVAGEDGNGNTTSVALTIERVPDTEPPLIVDPGVEPVCGVFCQSFTVTARIIDVASGVDVGSAIARLQHPDGIDVASITLYDDGIHGDDVANDSVFTGQWDSCSAVDEGIYYVDLEASDNQGNPVYSDNCASFELWQGVGPGNHPPDVPSASSPADGSLGVPVTVTLRWTGGDPDPCDSISYDVYSEAADDTPDVSVSSDQSSTVYDPGTLSHSIHYYWQVVAEDEHGDVATGPVWDFTTASVPETPMVGLVAGNDSPTQLGDATTLTATVSSGSGVIYTWGFGDNSSGSGQVVTHTYPITGVYAAVATASNSVSVLTATTTVTVTERICDCVTEIPREECEALVALYTIADGPNWADNTGWLETCTPCSWYSVKCSEGNVHYLYLDHNQLSGSIPTELGNLANLQYLHLASNRLKGNVPGSLANLVDLLFLDLGYNMLSASDAELLAFLGQKDPDWADTQTVPPTDVQVADTTTTSLELGWTPITYTANGGYYEVSYATTSGGPYTVHGVTDNKSASGYVLDGLSPGTTYYFVVRTHPPAHDDQQNDLWSEYSDEVVGTTLDAPP